MLDWPRRTVQIFQIIATLIVVAQPAFALDPSSPANHFIRSDFTVENGLPSNVVNAIVQTRNGFLWVGTDSGLARFNGRRFISIDFRSPQPAPQGLVSALAEGPDGDLWVGTDAGLARIRRPALDFFDRSLSTFYHLGKESSDNIVSLHFTPDGALWVGTSGGLYRFQNGRFTSVLSNVIITRIEVTNENHVLIVTTQGFLEWDGKQIVQHLELAGELGIRPDGFHQVFQDRQGITWFTTAAGLARRVRGEIERFSDYGNPAQYAMFVYEDGQGTIWVEMKNGLSRLSGKTLEPLALSQVRRAYSDRDGDLWVGTNGEGLLRFKERPVQMFTTADGLPSNIPMTVLSRRDGSLWVGSNCGGLSVFEHGRFKTYAEKSGLTNSCVWALAEDKDNVLWVGTWGGGLYRFADEHFTQLSIPQGLPSDVVRGLLVARDGSLWIAGEGGLSHLRNGQLRIYTVADGLSSNHLLAAYQDRHGAIWVGTSRGIDRMRGDRFVPVSSARKVFDSRLIGFGEDSSGDLYVMAAPKGIDRIEANSLVNLEQDLDSLNMVAFQRDFWFSGGNGLFRVPADSLKKNSRDRDTPLDYASFGSTDGMSTIQCSIGSPNMAIAPDHKLWVATVKGLAQLDLPRLQSSRGKPPIFVAEVTLGRTKQIAGRELLLPPGTHHVELHFDSISLKSPEKVRFQYRLDGVDPVWLDADSLLTAVYTNIPVGTHSFHVRASNSDGVWDPVGIEYQVMQQPFFYETIWFQLTVIAALVLLLAGLYFLRLRQIAHQYNLRLEERVNERTRIARELHDTLLQSFHGLMFLFHAVQSMLPDKPVQAAQSLKIAIDRASRAVIEGRDAILELRSTEICNSLVDNLTSLGQEFTVPEDAKPVASYRLLLEGTPRRLRPGLQADIYRILREAVANAFRHADATHIELDLCYETKMLRIRVRDDGVGMDRDVLAKGSRAGHWGLPGMQERAKTMNAQLKLWSKPGQGTEVELTVPAAVAYAKKEDD